MKCRTQLRAAADKQANRQTYLINKKEERNIREIAHHLGPLSHILLLL